MLRPHHSLLRVSAAEAAEIATPDSDFLVTPGDAHNQTDEHYAETIVIQDRMLTPYLCKSTHLMVHITLGIADMISPPVLLVVLTFHPVRTLAPQPKQQPATRRKQSHVALMILCLSLVTLSAVVWTLIINMHTYIVH